MLCGSYVMDLSALMGAYEAMAAAGIRVLSPGGLDFAEFVGSISHRDVEAFPPRAAERPRLEGIKAADLVWLHAPDGVVGLGEAMEIGFAQAAGVPVYAEKALRDGALAMLVTVASLDQVIAEAMTRATDDLAVPYLAPQEYDAAVAQARERTQKSADDIMLLITDEISQLARRNPGQRQRESRTSPTPAAASG